MSELSDTAVFSHEENVWRLEIPLKLDPDKVLKQMKLNYDSPRVREMIDELIQTAVDVARPKALYKISCVSGVDGDSLDIDGVKFRSKVLGKHLRNLTTVFPYIATCGQELDDISIPAGDTLRRFFFDSIKTMALMSAAHFMTAHLSHRYHVKRATHMNPGEIGDWPLAQQSQLFDLFSNPEASIGVTLLPGYLMKPLKSRSGIFFSNDTGFETCQLCTQENCPGRRAPYNPELLKEYA